MRLKACRPPIVMNSPVESGLFIIPREIRDDIYKRTLVITPTLHIFQESGQKIELFAPERPANKRQLSLLYVSRRLARNLREVTQFGMCRIYSPQVDKGLG